MQYFQIMHRVFVADNSYIF